MTHRQAGLARDLGSTNGSKINGERFREAALAPDTTITIGQTSLRFELVPSRTDAPAQQQRSSAGGASQSSRGPRADSGSGAGIEQDFWRGL